jgi:hypothetical protein
MMYFTLQDSVLYWTSSGINYSATRCHVKPKLFYLYYYYKLKE